MEKKKTHRGAERGILDGREQDRRMEHTHSFFEAGSEIRAGLATELGFGCVCRKCTRARDRDRRGEGLVEKEEKKLAEMEGEMAKTDWVDG